MKKSIVIGLIIFLIANLMVFAQNDTIPIVVLENETNDTVNNQTDDNATQVRENETVNQTIEETQDNETPVVDNETAPEENRTTQPADNETEQVDQGPGFFAGIGATLSSLVNRVQGAANWVITRDYLSAGRNLVNYVLGLSLAVKIVIVILIIILLIFIWAYYFRDTRANNMRKARKLHKKGMKEHENGNEEMAEYYYRRARELREKAQDQW